MSSLAALCVAALAAPVAGADHHLAMVREVYPGDAVNGDDAEFVELQLYSAGQNVFVGNNVAIRFYGSGGAESAGSPQVLATDPPNGDSQRTVLIATNAANDLSAFAPDYEIADADRLNPAGGAVCFTSILGTIDCVSWGTFSGSLSSAGTPETGPIPDGSSIERSIAPGCATLLEAGDDTNNSLADFAPLDPPTPRPNSVTPTETPCSSPPGGGAGTGPAGTTPAPAGAKKKKKCKKKKRSAGAAAKKCKKKKK